MQTVISNTHLPDTEMNSLTLNDAKVELTQIAKQAKEAAWQLAKLTAKQKNDFLHGLADALISKQDDILSANALDMTFAHSVEVAEAMLDRLRLTPERIAQIAHEVRHVASLPDPVGVTLAGNLLDSGLRLEKRAVPLGVVAVIYEARPNVTIDVASLCFKTGNAAILRGGKETVHTNRILVEIIQTTLLDFGLPTFSVQAILNPDRAYVSILLKLDQYIDMLIPRGGAGLHRLCKEHSTIPVITGGIGVCHIYLDNQYFPNQNLTSGNIDSKLRDAIDSALSIIDNAKIQRPSACNSLETLLVHTELAALFLPKLYHYMHQKSVVLRVCEQVEVILKEHCPILSGTDLPSGVQRVTQSDYEEESLGLMLNVKLVDSIDDAIAHIRAYGTDHSDSILTQNMLTADYFIDSIDSAAVYVNASTRFTDGAQFGLGAEVAVSTQKLHARGPMGLEALTTYKWIGRGDNVIRK